MHSILALLPLFLPQQAQDSLGYFNGPDWQPLEVDASLLGFRFDPSLTETEARELLIAIPLVDSSSAWEAHIVPGHTTVVGTLPGATPTQALAACEQARAMEGVWSASPRMLALEDPHFLTEEILVRWKPETPTSVRESLSSGLVPTGILAYSTNPGQVFRVPHGSDPLEWANRLAMNPWTEFSIPDFQLVRVTTGITNDPQYGNQWHLESTGQNGAGNDEDIDVEGAWAYTRGDASVCVAVVDTGVELGHPDLNDNLVQGIDVLDNDNNPKAEDFLFLTESHSTAVCGVAGAEGNNGIGVSGVAQNCSVMPIRFLSDAILWSQPTVQDEADAFNFARQNGASVVNNSWGPVGAATLPASTKAAIDDCNQNGRNGLGMVIFFAAGNSGSNNSNNGYASYSGVVGVSACNDQGVLSSYSSWGPSVDVCAPSNGGINGITTTDRLGWQGYGGSDYTSTFGGTSSASPCAAGVMCLIFSANPSLTRGEALDAMTSTAEKIDPAGGNYDASGHSDRYGYGRVNAADAVEAALGGGGGNDSIVLAGPSTATGGDVLNFTLSQGTPGTPWIVGASLSDAGTQYQGHAFDLGSPWIEVARGLFGPMGGDSFAVTIPGSVSGITAFIECASKQGSQVWEDSNLHTLTVQ